MAGTPISSRFPDRTACSPRLRDQLVDQEQAKIKQATITQIGSMAASGSVIGSVLGAVGAALTGPAAPFDGALLIPAGAAAGVAVASWIGVNARNSDLAAARRDVFEDYAKNCPK